MPPASAAGGCEIKGRGNGVSFGAVVCAGHPGVQFPGAVRICFQVPHLRGDVRHIHALHDLANQLRSFAGQSFARGLVGNGGGGHVVHGVCEAVPAEPL